MVNDAPIQEPTADDRGRFPQAWARWFQNIKDEIERLEGLVGSAETSFGETVIAENHPVIELTASYNLIPANARSFTATGGSTTAANRLFKVSTGTSIGGYGAIQSFRSVKAKAGQSVMSCFTGFFESNVENSWQGIGLISIGDELSFGYNGTDFGIWHRYGGLAEVRTITVTGAAGGAENLTLTLNDVAYTIPLTAGTVQHNAYEIAAWLNTNQSVWAADQLDDAVIINALSDGAKSGTYSFSSSTATGTITQDTEGVTKTSDHIPQEEWNGTNVSIDPSKGNVYQIIYQNMGFGESLFYIEDPATTDFVKVHTIRTANSQTTTALGNPSLRVGMYGVSLGSTTNLNVYVDAFSAFIQGSSDKTRNPRSYANTQTLSTTNFTNIMTLRNRRTYNGIVNQVEIEPLRLSIASEVNKNVIIEVRATTNTGVEQDYQTIGTNLVSDIDTTAFQSFSGGRLLDSFTVSPSGEGKSNLKELEIQVPPSLNFIIQARRTGGASGDVTATLTWYEDL